MSGTPEPITMIHLAMLPSMLPSVSFALFLVGMAGLLADIESSPTTLIGAFIAMATSLAGLVVWIVKRLFDELKESRDAFKLSIEMLHSEGERSLEALQRERQQQALFEEARTRRQIAEHTLLMTKINTLLDRSIQ